MTRFTSANADYSPAELAELNRRFEAAVAEQPVPHEGADDLAVKSWRDHLAERVQAEFDAPPPFFFPIGP